MRFSYAQFSDESGVVGKMAVIRKPLAPTVGRYVIGEPIASGGMATVHLGRLLGEGGFSRTVAIKRLHSELAATPKLKERFIEEARIASRIRHANVVPTLDVVATEDDLVLVLDYVQGESLAKLRRAAAKLGETVPANIAVAVVVAALRGLHALHEARSVRGEPLDLVHRDVSPQNVLVGTDGVARVLDFGVAAAEGILAPSAANGVRGKLSYMAPEQLGSGMVDRRCDLFSAAVMLWEAVSGERLFRSDDALQTMDAILHRECPRLFGLVPDYPTRLDEVLAKALQKAPQNRFATAAEMARALEQTLTPANPGVIAEWVNRIASDVLADRERQVAIFEMADLDERASSRDLDVTESGAVSVLSSRHALPPPPLTDDAEIQAAVVRANETVPDVTLVMDDPFSRDGRDGCDSVDPIESRRMHTPMTMVRPASSHPIPYPGNAAAAETMRVRPRKAPSPFKLAFLVVAPPILAAAAVLALRVTPARTSSVASASGDSSEFSVHKTPNLLRGTKK